MKTAKAVVAGVVSFGTTLVGVLQDDAVTADEAGLCVAAALTAFGAVWAVRNRPAI